MFFQRTVLFNIKKNSNTFKRSKVSLLCFPSSNLDFYINSSICFPFPVLNGIFIFRSDLSLLELKTCLKFANLTNSFGNLIIDKTKRFVKEFGGNFLNIGKSLSFQRFFYSFTLFRRK